MKSLTELDHLNLDPTAKTQVAALLQSLLADAERTAVLLQSKDEEIKAKEAVIKGEHAKPGEAVIAKLLR
jgi:hypothetical protein